MFIFVVFGIVWFIFKVVMGIWVFEEEEVLGFDKVEVGVEVYLEFGIGF